MKNTKKLMAVMLMSFSAGVLSAGENLVVNGGFEEERDGKPAGWYVCDNPVYTKGPVGIGVVEVNLDDKVFHSGGRSVRIEQVKPIKSPEKEDRGHIYIEQNVPVQEGKFYDLRFHYRAEGLDKQKDSWFQAWIYWMKEDGRTPVYQNLDESYMWVLNTCEDKAAWTEVVNESFGHYAEKHTSGFAYQAPAGAVWARVKFAIWVRCPTAALPKVWVDDVVFEENPAPNLLQNADDFTAKVWFSKNAVVASEKVAGPDEKHPGVRLTNKEGWIGQHIPTAIPGHSYRFSVWMKSADGKPQRVFLAGENNPPAPKYSFIPFDVTGEWKEYSMTFDCPAEGNSVFRFSIRDCDIYAADPRVIDVTPAK